MYFNFLFVFYYKIIFFPSLKTKIFQVTKIKPDDQLLLHCNKETEIIDSDEYISYNISQMNEKNPVLVFDLSNNKKSNIDFKTCKIYSNNTF
jgi:hypothetical protein